MNRLLVGLHSRLIDYATRDLGYGTEEGYGVNAYVTNEIDAWGKRTIYLWRDADLVPVYLFENEWSYCDA